MATTSILSKELFQNALIDAVAAGTFYRVVYDSTNNRAVVRDTTNYPPRSVKCNESESSFAPDTNHGKSYRLHRPTWRFALILVFDKEATIEPLINEICENPLKVTNWDGKFLGMLELQSYHSEHPVTGSPSTGSQFTILFSVNKFRK